MSKTIRQKFIEDIVMEMCECQINISNQMIRENVRRTLENNKNNMKTRDYTIRPITTEQIQCLAESNIGRRLTDTELKRLSCTVYEEEFASNLDCAFFEAIYEVTDDASKWKSYDEDYADDPLEKVFPKYQDLDY